MTRLSSEHLQAIRDIDAGAGDDADLQCMPPSWLQRRQLLKHIDALVTDVTPAPVPMRLVCPQCGVLHIDEGEYAIKPHHTHACQGCGMVWRPAIVPTVGVQFLPGFKNEPPPNPADNYDAQEVRMYNGTMGL